MFSTVLFVFRQRREFGKSPYLLRERASSDPEANERGYLRDDAKTPLAMESTHQSRLCIGGELRASLRGGSPPYGNLPPMGKRVTKKVINNRKNVLAFR